MKVLIYFLLTVSIFAQDSIKTKGLKLSNYNKTEQALRNKNNIKPLVNLTVNRNWAKGKITNFKNYKTLPILKITEQKKSFIDSDIFLIAVGSAVAFGTTSAYLKLQSDKYYDKYLKTNDVKYLDKTNRLDLYSGVSLGIMELNFGYLIYKFFTD